ncbi:hypothetical protein G9272_44255 [Streptomyces asoensis]|uniref:Uncharacterized protein n=1 Tax=Streptomyces asoensis TaxID=249586 RepID=A0A6M4WFT9_9ACTN|nr:hypothetical protein [Streptomyces asoensis]QJS99028.1 hypothetical protein G9272_00640 [Streptomyces asoensis]QJT06441.1 hypothetical protein G9272_44255 [Streptomyces asoensis]
MRDGLVLLFRLITKQLASADFGPGQGGGLVEGLTELTQVVVDVLFRHACHRA